MTLVSSVTLFSLACNLDTLVLAMGFGVRGVRPTAGGCLTLGAVTSLMTALALFLGRLGGELLPPVLAVHGGGLVLIGMGIWMLVDWLTALGNPIQGQNTSAGESYLPLAAALALNNAGAGLAAGVGGMPPLWGGLANLGVTLLLLPLGLALGKRLGEGRAARLALPLSGLLLLLLGGLQVWG